MTTIAQLNRQIRKLEDDLADAYGPLGDRAAIPWITAELSDLKAERRAVRDHRAHIRGRFN